VPDSGVENVMKGHLVVGILLALFATASCSILVKETAEEVTSPIPTEADSNGLIGVVRLLHNSLEEKDSIRIVSLMAPSGVYIVAKWPGGLDPGGLKSPEFVGQLLNDAFPASDPTCVGLNQSVGTIPAKALVVFSGLALDWGRAGFDEDLGDVVGFELFRAEDSWEIRVVLPVDPRVHIREIVDLEQCPVVEH
jgi:hypothetical protein